MDASYSWIGTRWLEPLLEASELRMSVRKGRILQRKGNVGELEVRPAYAEARVKTDKGESFMVRVKLAALPSTAWKRAIKQVAGEASLAAVVLRGRVDERIADLIMQANDAQAGLFANDIKDLNTACACTESASICSHGMAVHFELARLFESDPLLLVEYRGCPREELLAKVRLARSGGGGAAEGPAGGGRVAARKDAHVGRDDGLEAASLLDRESFWERGVMPHLAFQISDTEVADIDALPVLRALGPGPGDMEPEEAIDVLRPLLRTGRTRVKSVLERVGGEPESRAPAPDPVRAQGLDEILVAAAHQHGHLTSGFVADALGVSSREARQYLQWLVEEGRLMQVGRARGTRYEPPPSTEPAQEEATVLGPDEDRESSPA